MNARSSQVDVLVPVTDGSLASAPMQTRCRRAAREARHPSGMGSHSYYSEDSASENWRALALGFSQHALMAVNTLMMLLLSDLSSEVEQLAGRFMAIDC